jgi:hypothetical protein
MQDETFSGTDFTEAINQLLVAVNCPNKHRNFIDTLIGYAERKLRFNVFDLDLGRRADNQNNYRSDNSARKWVQRNRKNLQDWQEQNKVFLVEFSPGFRTGDKPPYNYVPSSYYLHIIEYAIQVLAVARKDEIWEKHPRRAIQKAAVKKAGNIITTPIVFKQRVPKDKDVEKQIGTKLQTALTNIEKAIELIEEDNLIIEGENLDRVLALRLAMSDLETHVPDD